MIIYLIGYPRLDELIAKDREFFIQILDTDVPLNILVDNIKSDIFWKRCYNSKWKDVPVISENRQWINVFMERHFADILENMNPRNYDPEKVNLLFVLFIIIIRIKLFINWYLIVTRLQHW